VLGMLLHDQSVAPASAKTACGVCTHTIVAQCVEEPTATGHLSRLCAIHYAIINLLLALHNLGCLRRVPRPVEQLHDDLRHKQQYKYVEHTWPS
jgi:hypothetical protein